MKNNDFQNNPKYERSGGSGAVVSDNNLGNMQGGKDT